MIIETETLSLLGCPQCKGALKQPDNEELLHCPVCQLDFPIEEGVAVLLLERAVESTREV